MAYGRDYYSGYKAGTAAELEPEEDLYLEAQIQIQPDQEIEPEEETRPTPARQVVPRVSPKFSGSPLGWVTAAVLAVAMTAGLLQGQSATMPSTAGQAAPAGQSNPLTQPGPAPLGRPNPQGLPQPGPATLPQAPQGGSSIPPASQPPINPPVEPMPKNPILPESKNVVVLSVPHPCSTFNLYHCEDYRLNIAQMAEVNSATVDVVDFINRGWVTIDAAGLEANQYLYGSYYGFYCPGGRPDPRTRMYEMLHPNKMVKIALTPTQITEAQNLNSLTLEITDSPLDKENDRTKSLPLDFGYGDWDKLYQLIDQPPYPPEVQQMTLEQMVKDGIINGFTALVSMDSRLSRRAKVIGIIAPAHLEAWVDTINSAYPGLWSQWSQTETLRNAPMTNLPTDKTPFQLLTFAPDEPMTMYATWHVRNPATGEETMWGVKIVAHY